MIREYDPADEEAVVALSLRAWAPVFAAVSAVLAEPLATLLHGEDWREHQEREVRGALSAPGGRAWVAEADGAVAAFAVARVADQARRIGEVHMLAVDPPAQRRGLGRALTDHATEWLRAAGMAVAVIGTGGDPGHAPARALYEGAGYRPFPGVQYFRAL